MNIAVDVKIKTQIRHAATGRIIKNNPWRKNLVLDYGLDGLAKNNANNVGCGNWAAMMLHCAIGTGTNPNRIDSGAVTFTQTTNQVTASGGFFTAGMVGGILKYGSGSGGTEQYITAFTSSVLVTVSSSATVGATVGTVWMVQQTTLQTRIQDEVAYVTTAGSCQTTQSTNSVTHQRTFKFATGPYSVNEIGYAPALPGGNAGKICGRFVLGSTDVVGAANFYVVIIQVTHTVLPGTPSAVPNVGTNINTAGNAQVEVMDVAIIASSGGVFGTGTEALDGSNGLQLSFSTTTYTQNANTTPSTPPAGWTNLNIGQGGQWVYGGTLGKATLTNNLSISTSGQNLFGIGLTGNYNPAFDVKFTATQTAPSGTFNPVTVFSVTHTRTLTN